MFGLSGAHRTGKTTLAQDVAVKLGIHFHNASVSKILKERCGIDPVLITDLGERIKAQGVLLDVYLEQLALAPRPAITDRTPLDMAMYMMGECGMHSDPELGEQVWKYAERCVFATEKHFDSVFIVAPLPHYVAEEGKPANNRGYQWHLQFLLRGLADATKNMCLFKIGNPDRECRTEMVGGWIAERLEEYRAAIASLRPH